MTSALLALALWGVQGSEVPVHVEPIVGTMRVLCPKLSAQLKLKLESSTATMEEVVGLSIESATPTEILDHIAQTINATWQRQGNTFTLMRTREQEAQNAARDFEHRKSRFVKELADMQKKVAEEATFGNTEADNLARRVVANRANRAETGSWYPLARAYDHLAPGSRMVSRILSLFAPADLASVSSHRRVVYSTDPTAMQLRLTGKFEPIIADFYREQAVYADALERANGSAKDNEQVTYPGLQAENGKKPDGSVERINVAFSTPRFGSGMTATVYLINAKGQYILRADHTFNENAFSGFTDTIPPADDTVDLQPMSVEFTNVIKNFASNKSDTTLPKDLFDYMSNPAQNDPLSLVIPETLGALGREKKANVVLHGSDFLLTFSLRPGSKPGKASVKHFLSSLAPCDLTVHDEKGWCLIEQEEPIRIQREQINRPAATELINVAKKQNRFPLDDLAKYVYRVTVESVSGIAGTYIVMTMPNVAGFELLNSPEFLRLYATLTNAQKSALQGHQKLSAPMMSPAQQTILADMVYGPNANFTYHSEAPAAAGDAFIDPYSSTLGDPTESLPRGLTADVMLSADTTDRDVLYGFSKLGGPMRAPRAMDPPAIAWDEFMRERPDLFSFAARMPVNDQFLRGHQLSWNFELSLTKALSLQGSLADNMIQPGAPMTRKELPADMIKEIDRQVASLRENYKGVTPEQLGNGKKIKPPR